MRLNPIGKWLKSITWMIARYLTLTFGIIVGCIYSSFIQTYTNQDSTPNSQDIEEFTEIIVKNSKKIKESILIDNDSKLEQ